MSVEDEHFDVLQNMEFAIVQIHRSTSDLIDAEVLNAIESLIHSYNLELKGGFAASPKVKGLSATVAAAVKEACEIRFNTSRLRMLTIEIAACDAKSAFAD